MVKLDISLLRFLEDEDFRVLTALEMAMRNHELAPTALVERIARLPRGGVHKRLQHLLKYKIIHHENKSYDGYSMKYLSYDYLALRTLSKRGSCIGVAHRIGCGKESDIILVIDGNEKRCVLKLQRLGRCSFRTVSKNRDYKGGFKKRHGESWFYLSRLASQKEYTFMKILYDEGFPVPKPLDQNRHALLMELVPGTLLNNIGDLEGQEAKVYKNCLDLMIKLAENGLVHGDFNEFNLMIRNDNLQVVMIDFPQMVSINHKNASELFSRDVNNLANFFQRRFGVRTLYYPTLEDDVVRKGDLDRQVFASGYFSQQDDRKLEAMLANQKQEYGDDNSDADTEEEEDEEDNDDDDDDDDDRDNELDRDGNTDEVHSLPWRSTDARPSHYDPNGDKQHSDDEDDEESGEEAEEEGEDEEDAVPKLEAASATPAAATAHEADTYENRDEARQRLDEGIARTKERRRLEREAEFKLNDKRNNPNYNANGHINEQHLKKQIRKNLQRADNNDFNKHLNRNVQKGRKKRRAKAAVDDAVQDYYESRGK